MQRVVRVELTPEVSGYNLPRYELDPEAGGNPVAVVVAVLRASTTIIQALAAGAVAVVPCASAEQARLQGGKLNPMRVLLAGEKGGLKPAGFDLGNSPVEYTAIRLRGKTVFLGTTNGTRALVSVSGFGQILVGAFVNLSALINELSQQPGPVRVVCAGHLGQPCDEDTLFAGWLVRGLTQIADTFQPAKDAGTARALAMVKGMTGVELPGALLATCHGKNLLAMGFGADVARAAALDSLPVVPQLRRDPLRLELMGPGPRD